MADEREQLTTNDLTLLKEAADSAQRLEREIGKIIVGQRQIVRAMLTAVFAQGHTLLIGVPGLAKTLLVRTLAQTLGWNFRRIQFTPDMMPSDIIGMELLQDDPQTGRREMRFMQGPVFTNLLLADEINRTPPKTQSALLEAMQELTVTSLGRTHTLERPFLVFATQNPIEQEGTYPLPEAQLDRFMFSLWLDYPSRSEEESIVAATTFDSTPTIESVLSHERTLAYQHLVRRMPASRHAVSHAVAIARATRPREDEGALCARKYVEWGAGPRASQHMVLAAKALAVLDGRPAVSAADIREAAPLVLRHRVLPNYTAAGDGLDANEIVRRILDEVREPSYASL
ncbi:MAG: MoxR family ATPase [Phycisphaerae bacterium]|nr:MoxR family ATPase [Phycisphaerae bacterium]